MRRMISFVMGLTALGLLATTEPGARGEEVPAELKVGNNLPGPLHPFYITGPDAFTSDGKDRKAKFRNHFHCPISKHGLDPLVLIFTRDLDGTEPFKDLIGKLDNAAKKNPNVRLGVCIVFLSDDLPDVVANDDKREELVGRIETLARAINSEITIFSLDSKNNLGKYAIPDTSIYTVVTHHKYRIVDSFTLSKKEDLDEAQVQKVMEMVEKKLGATLK